MYVPGCFGGLALRRINEVGRGLPLLMGRWAEEPKPGAVLPGLGGVNPGEGKSVSSASLIVSSGRLRIGRSGTVGPVTNIMIID